jgi:hypothetical protein
MSNRVNLSPLHWGPKTWFFLESAAIAYPTHPTEEEKTSAKNLLLSLKDLLPCLNCRLNYASYLDEQTKGNDLDYLNKIVENRETFITFIINVHNDVRIRNGQEGRSIDDVFNYYQQQYSKKPEKNFENFDNKIRSKEDIINSMNYDNKFRESFTSEMLFHFNPITLLIGFMLGLIIYKFYSDSNNNISNTN